MSASAPPRRKRTHTRRRERDASPDRMCIGLCIPFDIDDLSYLPQCLLSIRCQRRQPDLIVFSFSRVPDGHVEGIRSLVEKGGLIPSVTSLFSADRLFPGANRNRAAAVAIEQGATHLTFYDADDIAHPLRLELVERAFLRTPGISGVLHGFVSLTKKLGHSMAQIPWRPITGAVLEGFLYPMLSKKSFWRVGTKEIHDSKINSMDVHNGHPTVTVAAWKAHPYLEELRMGEDNHFNASLMAHGYKFVFLPDSLTGYLHIT